MVLILEGLVLAIEWVLELIVKDLDLPILVFVEGMHNYILIRFK
jgi:hypothetical protein